MPEPDGIGYVTEEPNRTVTCMVLKATANDRRHLALCPGEFHGPRSGICRLGGCSSNNTIAEVVELATQMHLEVDSDDVQELLYSHNQKLTIDELIEIHEQEQNVEKLESNDPFQ
ncbi:hypothetical protein TNCV_2857361 [Trichonephila clavipes]|nr:hypothetical protein TNCV_2857361 [Trichonephila clavipes]